MATGYYAVLLCSLFWVALHDIRTHRIPDKYTVVLALYGSASPIVRFINCGAEKPGELWILLIDSLLGAILGGGSLLITSVITKGGFGGGDVKLMAGLGLALGLECAVSALLLAILTAVFAGLIQRKYTGKGGIHLPFAPFLLFGCCIAAYFYM